MTGVGDLAPFGDELLLLVMGPGLGESVLVRWPPDCWLIVDSFHRTRRTQQMHPAADALDIFGEQADAVVLTHPHDDHTGGLGSLIDRRKPGALVGWWPDVVPGARWTTANGSVARRQGNNEQALAAIERTWRQEPQSRWELDPAAPPVQFADATVEVLTPLEATINHNRTAVDPNYNELSSAMLVSWRECRLLLGADLINIRGWNSLEAVHGALAFSHTTAMKVAHHGSKEAQHTIALGNPPPTARTYVGTPYSRGRKVPDFRDGEDVELLLGVMDRLLMTGHHGPLPLDSGTQDVPRTVLSPEALVAGPLRIDFDPQLPPPDDCWIAARWAGDGTLTSVVRGPGSLSIVA